MTVKKMKTKWTILLIVSFIWLCSNIYNAIVVNYEYRQIESYWNLAYKSSIISEKAKYIDKFVSVLEKSELSGIHSVFFLKTSDNSFDENFEVLKSLQKRLHKTKTVNITSFEYQLAIRQITEEQSKATKMLNVFRTSWLKKNSIFLCSWVGLTNILLNLVFLSVALYKRIYILYS
jgi:hypothetical protein